MSVGTKHADGLSGCLTQPVSMAFTTPPRRSATTKRARDRGSLSAPDATKLQIGRERLAGLGVETRVFPTADPDRDEPASPAARARRRGRLFADPEIGAVMAYTGGDDQIRVLRHLDGDALAASPTRFFGYSDNDNLRLFLWNRGIVSYGLGVHPDLVCDADLHTYTERYLRRALFEESLGRIVPADEWTDDWFDFEAREPREGTIPRPDDVGGAGGRLRRSGPRSGVGRDVRDREVAPPDGPLPPGARPTRRGRPSRWRPRRTYRRRARSATRFARWVSAGC